MQSVAFLTCQIEGSDPDDVLSSGLEAVDDVRVRCPTHDDNLVHLAWVTLLEIDEIPFYGVFWNKSSAVHGPADPQRVPSERKNFRYFRDNGWGLEPWRQISSLWIEPEFFGQSSVLVVVVFVDGDDPENVLIHTKVHRVIGRW